MTHVVNETPIALLRQLQLMIPNESTGLVDVSEVEPVPIQNGTTSKDQSNRFDVVKREIVDSLQPLPSARTDRGSAWAPFRGFR